MDISGKIAEWIKYAKFSVESPEWHASHILAIIKEAGYMKPPVIKVCDGCPDRFEGCVELSKDQNPPVNPFDKSCGLNVSAHNGFELAKLKYRHWRKVELKVKDEQDNEDKK